MIEASRRLSSRFSSMPPHARMPHGIPPPRKGDNHQAVIHWNGRKPSINPHQAAYKPKPFDEYISHVDVIPGNPTFVIAELREVTVNGEFILQPAKTPEDPLIFAAKARIGLNQEGFVVVKAGSFLIMRVGDAAGPLQEKRVEMPSYDPSRLVVEYNNNLIIVSAT